MPLFHRKSNSLGTPAVAGPGAGYGNTYGPAYAPAYPTYGSAMGATPYGPGAQPGFSPVADVDMFSPAGRDRMNRHGNAPVARGYDNTGAGYGTSRRNADSEFEDTGFYGEHHHGLHGPTLYTPNDQFTYENPTRARRNHLERMAHVGRRKKLSGGAPATTTTGPAVTGYGAQPGYTQGYNQGYAQPGYGPQYAKTGLFGTGAPGVAQKAGLGLGHHHHMGVAQPGMGYGQPVGYSPLSPAYNQGGYVQPTVYQGPVAAGPIGSAATAVAPGLVGGAGMGMGQGLTGVYNPLLDIYYMLMKNEIPHNTQLIDCLMRAKQALEIELRQPYLNAHGVKLATDLDQILSDVAALIVNRNTNEHLQKAIFYGTKATAESFKQASAAGVTEQVANTAAEATSQMRYKAKTAVSQLQTVVWDLFRSPDFRMLLIEAIDLFKEAFNNVNMNRPSITESLKADAATVGTGTPVTKNAVTQTARNVVQTAVNQGLPVSEERKQIFIAHAKQVLTSFSQHPGFGEFLNTLFSLISTLRDKMANISTNMQQVPTGVTASYLQQMWVEIQALAAEFVGASTANNFFSNLQGLFYDVKNDSNMSRFFTDVRVFILDMLNNPQLINSYEASERFNNLYCRAQQLWQSNVFSSRMSTLLNLASSGINTLSSDAYFSKLSNDIQNLFRDVCMDTNRTPSMLVLFDSLYQFKNLLVPIMLKELEWIQLPKMQGSSVSYDWSVDNIVLNAYDILPNFIDVGMDNDVHMSTFHMNTVKSKARFQFQIRNVALHMRDVAFWFKKKRGFPKLEDRGLVDIDTWGNGATISLYWKVVSQGNEPFRFFIEGAWVDIDRLNLKFKNVRHNFLLNTATKLFNKRIKRSIERSIEEQLIKTGRWIEEPINKLSEKIFGVIMQDPYYNPRQPGRVLNSLNSMWGKAKSGINSVKQTNLSQRLGLQQPIGGTGLGMGGLGGQQDKFDVTVKVPQGVGQQPVVFNAHNVTPGHHVFVHQQHTPGYSTQGGIGQEGLTPGLGGYGAQQGGYGGQQGWQNEQQIGGSGIDNEHWDQQHQGQGLWGDQQQPGAGLTGQGLGSDYSTSSPTGFYSGQQQQGNIGGVQGDLGLGQQQPGSFQQGRMGGQQTGISQTDSYGSEGLQQGGYGQSQSGYSQYGSTLGSIAQDKIGDMGKQTGGWSGAEVGRSQAPMPARGL